MQSKYLSEQQMEPSETLEGIKQTMESASLTSKLKEPASHITLQTSEVA
jgi:hypothetical protein